MGQRMNCVTTPKIKVTHGDANHSNKVASPPPPPTGAVGGSGAPQPLLEVVTQIGAWKRIADFAFHLVPMPGTPWVGGFGGRGSSFALCDTGGTK